jgi:hypothetical protein
VLLFNGQEVGEPGGGEAGFSTDDGRTTAFDYWCMREFARWVNGHAYDGGGLSEAQKALRRFYADLLALCQDRSVRAEGYWGLKYHNRSSVFSDCPDELYTFARFEEGSGRLLLVAANFRPGAALGGQVRLPEPLAERAGLAAQVTVRLVLDRSGAKDLAVAQLSRAALVNDGFTVSIPDQTAHVYAVEG